MASGSPQLWSSESYIMYDMIGVFVAASNGITALNFFIPSPPTRGLLHCPSPIHSHYQPSSLGLSLIYWLSALSVSVLQVVCTYMCVCVWLSGCFGWKIHLNLLYAYYFYLRTSTPHIVLKVLLAAEANANAAYSCIIKQRQDRCKWKKVLVKKKNRP